MAAVILSEDIQLVVDAEVRENGFSSASDYISFLVKDAQRRNDAEVEALIIEGIESGEEEEVTPESWRALRRELHRQAGIE